MGPQVRILPTGPQTQSAFFGPQNTHWLVRRSAGPQNTRGLIFIVVS